MLDLDGCINLLFESYARVRPTGYDVDTRDLSGMYRLFQLAQIPTSGAPIITVAGSKGKGSTALLAQAMLMGVGHRVGLVLSPHLVDFRERIRVNGEMIPPRPFISIVNQLEPHIRAVDWSLPKHRYLSPTGLVLAVAMRWFAMSGVTAVVLEAGRGGRLDDVNLFDNLVTCLTPIMGEHLDKLGPTLMDVAWHKVGLIKADSVVISAPQSETVAAIIEREARQKNAALLRLGKEIRYEHRTLAPFEQEVTVTIDACALHETFTLQTAGQYQAGNVAAACGAVAALFPDGQIPGAPEQVARLRFPGRCERLAEAPLVLVDGAINRESATRFLESAAPLARPPVILVTALPDDKDAAGLLDTLMPHAAHTIITRASNPHLHFSQNTVVQAQSRAAAVSDEPEPPRAFTEAIKRAGRTGTIWVVGTQSLVRDALIHWEQTVETVFERR